MLITRYKLLSIDKIYFQLYKLINAKIYQFLQNQKKS